MSAKGILLVFSIHMVLSAGLNVCRAEEETVYLPFIEKLPIAGTAQGGKFAIGRIDGYGVVEVDTKAGLTAPQIVDRLSTSDALGGETFREVISVDGGVGVPYSKQRDRDLLFVSTDDPGLKHFGPVAGLKAKAIKTSNRVRLSWTLPSPQPESIVVFREGEKLAVLNGSAVTYDDSAPIQRPAFPGDTYTVACVGRVTDGGDLYVFNPVRVVCERPVVLENDDDFVIRTTQDFIENGVKGEAYKYYFQKRGGCNPVRWSIVQGALPAGLLFTEDGVVSGTPSATGVYNFTVKLTDADGATVSKPFYLKID